MTRVLCVVLLLATGCGTMAGRQISHGSTTGSSIEGVPVLGRHVEVHTRSGSSSEGELIAVDDEALYVLANDGEYETVPLAAVDRVTLSAFENEGTVIGEAAFTSAILASTPSHGLWAVLSVPAVATTYGIAGESALSNDVFVHPDGLAVLRQYARFPQGRPGHVMPQVYFGVGQPIETYTPPRVMSHPYPCTTPSAPGCLGTPRPFVREQWQPGSDLPPPSATRPFIPPAPGAPSDRSQRP